MSLASSTDALPRPQTRLRLVDGCCGNPPEGGSRDERSPEQPVAGEENALVLVAGARASTRSRMLDELRNLLPASTRYLEADGTWEVLACAPSSHMVVLTDDLGDVSAGSLVRVLGQRHPTLPVLAVGEGARAKGRTGAETTRP